MDFFGMGMGEVLLIIIVALIVWGPGRIVDISRTLGKTVRTLRKTTSDLTTAVTREINLAEKERPSRPRTHFDDSTKEPPDVNKTEPNSTETSPRQ